MVTKRKPHRAWRLCVTLLPCVALLGACSGLPAVPAWVDSAAVAGGETVSRRPDWMPALPPAPRPRYAVGDTYIWHPDQVVRVQNTGPGPLVWSTSDASFQASADFFVPPTRHRSVSIDVERQIIGAPDALWPLSEGRTVRFIERRIERPVSLSNQGVRPEPALTELEWTCSVSRPRMSAVPAGDYAVYPVTCRARNASLPWVADAQEWEYAPALGHVVRHRWYVAGQSRQRVLAAAIPGPVATPSLIQSILRRLASP